MWDSWVYQRKENKTVNNSAQFFTIRKIWKINTLDKDILKKRFRDGK